MKTIFLLACIGLVACGAQNENAETSMSKADYANAEAAPMSTPDDSKKNENMARTKDISASLPDVVTPKLIRTADLRFQVKDLEISSEAIEKSAALYKAYVSSANMSSSNYEASNTITIRVPNDGFEPLLKAISKESVYMERKNVSTQDVTEEYVDIETRLKTKKEVEARYIDILRNKAKTVEDVLKAEEQIRYLREEIEAREGRLNYLQNQVAYSTITVQVYQQIEYHENPEALTESFGSKASSGFGQGWTVIQNIMIGIITIWPLLVIALITWIIIRKQLKKKKAKA